jgi:MFS family permease
MARNAVASAWTPFRSRVFRALWIATLVSNLGTALQNTAAAWLMTSLTRSAVLISMVQTASTLPVLLLGLPAGAIADIVDRRRFLLLTQAAMLMAALLLGIASLSGFVTPAILLLLTFAMGVGAALNGPAWQAVIGEVVPLSDLAGAVSLNSAGFNIARAVGPALAGLLMIRAGAGWVFLLNALSFVGVLWVLFGWRPAIANSAYPVEHVVGAVKAGFRYLLYARELRSIVLRTVLFAFPASALWALLPVVSTAISSKALTYGILLGGLGLGALAGAVLLPAFKGAASVEGLILFGTVAFALASFALAMLRDAALLFVVLVIGGVGWLVLLSTLNAGTRLHVPRWVEARALAAYLVSFQGSLAVGSIFWGAIAGVAGTRLSLLCACGLLLAGLAARLIFPLNSEETLDLRPANSWPLPGVASDLAKNREVVLVVVEYSVPTINVGQFAQAMQHLRTLRLRDGAFRWALFEDANNPTLYEEHFMVESWEEHLRQHERLTVADLQIQESVRALLATATSPRISHYFTVQVNSELRKMR